MFVAAAIVAPCLAAPAPANLTGKTVVLNYTQSQYCYAEEDAPGKGGKYTYRKTGADTGTIEVNMAPMDAGRIIILKFTSANTAIATEEVGAGCMVNTIRNIQVTIK